MSILLIGPREEDDPCVALVAAALRRLGAEPWILSTEDFPGRLLLSFAAEGAPSGSFNGVDLTTIQAVWVRHMEAGEALPAELDPTHREICIHQAQAALWSMLDCLDVFVVDPPVFLLGSPRKPGMQRLAQRYGLRVPRSLVSNDPAAVAAFSSLCPGGMIVKLIESGGVMIREDGKNRSFPTMELAPGEPLPGLELAPMLFQEKILKRRELRLTVVGPKVFSAAVEPGEVLDWRTDAAIVQSFRAFDGLPKAVEAAVLGMMDELGLDFGTVDLIETPEGDFVFLEINSISFFDHVQRYAGLPIAEAVAELLLGILPSRFEARRKLQQRM